MAEKSTSTGPEASANEVEVSITAGTCHALFAYDVGWSVDLDVVERRMAALTERSSIRRRPRAPQYLEFRPAPLRIVQEAAPLSVSGFATRPNVDLLLYDFGALSVSYHIPLAGATFPRLLDLGDELSRISSSSASRARASSSSST